MADPLDSAETLRRLRAAHDVLGVERGASTSADTALQTARMTLAYMILGFEMTKDGQTASDPTSSPAPQRD
ncbi:hypothetical protein [uncultured Hyphomonas sp.]|uniref:hypothetical protein n=1 Tax=uncultured Hyphomonas sp. TaxID=225298 RepID=UPI0011892936|nr:MAG: hypothetical protein GOVbin258_53 [Prokaryotic dsDNA virus sp.]|tara:strand:+ start:775 stop:987 length:213 start_codon:yes stop_codon:yes gene_type:complete